MERRRAIKISIKAMALLPAAIIGFPAIAYLLSPSLKRSENEWRVLGPADEFPVGTMKEARIHFGSDSWNTAMNQRSVYVWRETEEDFVVFSRSCTDLGCPVVWDAGSQWFYCPCHGGIFNKEGDRKAGPPRKPLYRYASRTRDGNLEVDTLSVPPML